MARDNWNHYRLRQKATPELFTCRIPDGLTESEIGLWADGLKLGILEEYYSWLWVREWNGEKVIERPVYLDTELEERIEGYFRLVWERPELFVPSEHCPILVDRYRMLKYMEEQGKPVGLIMQNGSYYHILSDLFDTGHDLRPYVRVIYPDHERGGTVIIPRLLNKGQRPLFGILHQFRHPIRKMTGGEFPRGFQAPGILPGENAAKELWEEFRITADRIQSLTLLGSTRPDTGLRNGSVQIYLADVTGPQPRASVGHEGITDFEWITEEELLHRIQTGKILDGMTHTAMLFFLMHAGKI